MSTPNSTKDLNTPEKEEKGILAKNKKMLTAAIAVAVLALGVFGFKQFYLQPKEDKAQTNLTLGLQYLEEGENLNAQVLNLSSAPDSVLTDSVKNQIETFKQMAADQYNKALNGDGKFPGYLKLANEGMTDAANIAVANAGLCYFNLGNFKEAIKYLEKFSAKSDKGLSAQYVAALANSYASDNQIDKAIATFKKAADVADNAITSPQYLLEAGLLLESQQKPAEALDIYKSIKSKYPNSTLVAPQQVQVGAYAALIDKYIERVSK